MDFPVEDVVINFNQFITSVKRATGNAKDPDAADRKLRSAGGSRPGMCPLAYSNTVADLWL
jgi:large subunit ribosomal protein L1